MKHPLQGDYTVFDEISHPTDNVASLENSVKWHLHIYVKNESKIYQLLSIAVWNPCNLRQRPDVKDVT